MPQPHEAPPPGWKPPTLEELGDMVLTSVHPHFAASKRRSYREATLAGFRDLIAFLEENDLTCRPILADGEEVGEQTEIRTTHLTEEGYAFYDAVENGWCRSMDPGRESSRPRVFARALAKVRRERSE